MIQLKISELLTIFSKEANERIVKDNNEIIALKQQLAEAQSYKADAERYRWLRDIGCVFWTDLYTNKEVKHQVCEQAMDYVIDQAMK